MATNDEIFRIILETEGEQKAQALANQLEQAESVLGRLLAQQRATGGTGLASAIDAQASSVARLRGEMSSAEAGLTKMAGSGRNSGFALMEISRAAEDAQYGLNGVLNNLPGLVMSLGGSAGLVGVVSLVAVGAYQLYKNWDSLASVWGGGHTRTQAEEMEELRKKTSLTADEAERLGRASALQSKVKELQEGRTKEQKKTDDAATEAIIEAGADDVVRGMLRARPDLVDAQGDVPAALKHSNWLRDVFQANPTEDNRANMVEAGEELGKAREKTAREIVASGAISQFFPGGLGQLIASVQKDPGAFGPRSDELLAGLRDATPAGRADKEKADAESDAVWEESQESIKAMKAYQKKRRDDEAKALEIEARENEKGWDEEVRAATRTRSFQGKSPGSLTPAEKEAQRLHDEKEAPRERERAEKEASKARMAAPGLDEYLREELMAGASEGALAGMLRGLGFSDEESADLLDKGAKGAMEAGLKGEEARSSQTFQGGQALAQAIQAGVSNEDVGKQQLARLDAAVGYLQRIAEQSPDMTARVT